MSGAGRSRSAPLQPLVERLAELAPGVRVTAFDGAAAGPGTAEATIAINTPQALLRIVRAPRGLGLGRACVAGDIELGGEIRALAPFESSLRDPLLLTRTAMAAAHIARTERRRAFIGTGPTEIEARAMRFRPRSIGADIAAVEHHYGLSVDFYRVLLGPSMTYSSAMFADSSETLEEAQERKHARIVEKLRLDSGSCLLDIGCGWGELLRHATASTGCSGIGLTASSVQAVAARSRVGAPGRATIHEGDFRRLLPLRASAVSSVGMYEHVGARNSERYLRLVRGSLPVGGRYLHQSIVRRRAPPRVRAGTFTRRYIWPNGQLLPLARQLDDIEHAGFRLRGVEGFGDSYAETLGRWMHNLDADREYCEGLEGAARVRAWKLYLAGARQRFEDRSIDVVQVLAEAV